MYKCTKRLGFNHIDNLINYGVGPVKIKLNVYTEELVLETNPVWINELENLKLAIQCCLKIENFRISYKTQIKIIIKINYKIMRKYLFYSILYVPATKEIKEKSILEYKNRIIEINNGINLSDDI